MVPGIARTSQLVQEISTASGEQAQGVQQITTAMNHLNHTTQQNAAASEQLSATAEELSGQAMALLDMMTSFRLTRSEVTPQPATVSLRPARHATYPSTRRTVLGESQFSAF